MNMAATLQARPLVHQDLSQLAHQQTAIARVLARDPDPRNRARTATTAEDHHVPGGAADRNVHSTDQRLVVKAAPPNVVNRRDESAEYTTDAQLQPRLL